MRDKFADRRVLVLYTGLSLSKDLIVSLSSRDFEGERERDVKKPQGIRQNK